MPLNLPLGILNGDEIISINATEVTKENFRELYLKTFRNYDSDAEVTMMVKRNGRTVNHRAKPWPGEMTMLNAVLESEDALEKQLELREVFLGRGK